MEMHFNLSFLVLLFLGTFSDSFLINRSLTSYKLRNVGSLFSTPTTQQLPVVKTPRVEIEYCPGCKWMLRSSWYAQEILTTFEGKIGEIALIPSPTSGTFIIRINNKQIWDRRDEKTKGFPEIKELKQLVRDIIAPDQGLGHSDKKS